VETCVTIIGYLELGITKFEKNKDFGYWDCFMENNFNNFTINKPFI
jgi:hypothetical protein